jgi:hypothetical protein
MNYRISIAPPESDDATAADFLASAAMLERVDLWREIVADKKRILVAPAKAADASRTRPMAAIALARALAATDVRVVAIDLHVDNAASTALGEASDRPGFADLIGGDVSYADVIFRDRDTRVHFIPNGLKPLLSADPGTLARLDVVLEALSLTYDYVVLEVEDESLATLAPFFPVAMVATEAGTLDPRAAAAIARISTASEASIHLLLPDPGEIPDESQTAA